MYRQLIAPIAVFENVFQDIVRNEDESYKGIANRPLIRWLCCRRCCRRADSDGGTDESTEDGVKKSQQLAISVFQRALGTQRNQKGWSVVVSRGA